ncbi:signal transduction histidine kinase [Caulobacter sp. AP07]|uniref:response regulator n=1 Tax=Caulobacter sp. AP07 TaxID=1144304 RepID=UPI000271E815|nr:response regulator [Caulobacter sp. AP07]EJL38403.1 signal transduction histidine kinase [Caulobacter sp. AP07]
MVEQTLDVTRLDGFVRYTRGLVLSRLGLVACFVGLLAIYTPLSMTLFGGVELVLYAALLGATELAVRHSDPVAAFRRLRWRSIALVFLLSINACWLAVQIRQFGPPIVRVEAALLVICVLLFAALRVHTNRVSYVTAIGPPVVTLIWFALDRPTRLADNHYAIAMTLFVAAVLSATWRQQKTDRALARTLRDLARKNVALTQAIEEAQAASRAKSELLAVASHEIRTPLNAVMGFAHALRRETLLTPTQAELAQGVLDGGGQLTRLLDTVLDLTRLEAGKAQLRPAAVDLRHLARTVVRVWSAHAEAVGVVLSFEDADPALSFGLLADEAKLEQTLVNLVSNALKATPSGGRVAVRLAGVARDQALAALVEVRDTGSRVPPDDRARMFEAFEQTERGRRLGGGGLGLAICAANLALMGGEIGVDDAPTGDTGGRGAVFWFAFEAPILAAPAVAVTVVAEPRVAGPIRVLAAEDNPANRRVLAALLAASPVELVFAEDGARALDAWRAQAFDLVLMDVNMPVLNGLAALAEIRRAEPAGTRIPVWMLTANVFDDDVARYRRAGADGVLRKPIDTVALFSLLAAVAEARAEAEAGMTVEVAP